MKYFGFIPLSSEFFKPFFAWDNITWNKMDSEEGRKSLRNVDQLNATDKLNFEGNAAENRRRGNTLYLTMLSG